VSEIINWRNLPNIPHIMVEFIAGNSQVVSLLGGDWRDKDMRAVVGERRLKFNRNTGLGNALRAGYGDIQIPGAVEENLAALNRSDTLAVVTGQQVGILGGPIYTFYKALTAVLLAERLEKEASGRVVPIFWMETSDADFSEINRISFPAGKDASRYQVYAPRGIIPGQSVNFHKLTAEIGEVNRKVAEWLDELPHRDKIVSLIERSYYPGRAISEAFMDLMTGLLGAMGLVMINPLHEAVVARTV